MYANKQTEVISTTQDLYDAYNTLIFSADEKLLAKFFARVLLCLKVAHIPGDIVELGVFKGAGMAAFVKSKHMILPKISPLKVVGFDQFNTPQLLSAMQGLDKDMMSKLFHDRNILLDEKTREMVERNLVTMGASSGEFEIVDGNINDTVKEYVRARPGFRARLVYVDVDVYEPTMAALVSLWDRIPVGGIIAFDDYGIDQWSEARAVDEFLGAIAPKSQLVATNLPCPTCYHVKTEL